MIMQDQSILPDDPTTDLLRMLNDSNLQTSTCCDIPSRARCAINKADEITENSIHYSDLSVEKLKNGEIDKVKEDSWDRCNSLHATSRQRSSNRFVYDGINDNRQWSNLDSLHSIKTMTWNDSYSSQVIEQKKPISLSEPGLQNSNSSYNDSSCSFASFGESSLSDNIDNPVTNADSAVSKSSIYSASKAFTMSLDTSEQPKKQLSHRQLMMRGPSYRNCCMSLSKIQETSLD